MIGQEISHYKIVECLGSGGMGVVYRAEDARLKRSVAIKLLPDNLIGDRTAKERFLIEAQAASALDHPNICTIHEIGQMTNGRPFIVMAYYKGENLKKRIGLGPLKMEEAIDIAVQIAEGLAAAHANGIVHRDIKPANIILTVDGAVKILDFGLAKLAQQVRLTRTGAAMGTIAYMSPEQIRGDPADSRMDIWALGIVLYEMLTGRAPFSGEYEAAQMYSIMHDEPVLLSEYLPYAAPALIGILDRALKKDPEERYQSALGISADLKSVAGRQPPGKDENCNFSSGSRSMQKLDKHSYLGALAAHFLFGAGLFYVDRRSKRKWLYVLLFLYAIVALALGRGLGIQYFRGDFGLYSFITAVLLYELSFFDVLITCARRRRGIPRD